MQRVPLTSMVRFRVAWLATISFLVCCACLQFDISRLKCVSSGVAHCWLE